MALVTGNLGTFGLTSVILRAPRILFVPSGPATAGSYLFASRPVEAVIANDGSGAFTVNLMPTTEIRPAAWYTIRIEWLESASNYVGADFPEWKVFVPNEGGVIGDLIATPWNPTLVWWGESEPLNKPAYSSLWLNPSTGTLKVWN